MSCTGRPALITQAITSGSHYVCGVGCESAKYIAVLILYVNNKAALIPCDLDY